MTGGLIRCERIEALRRVRHIIRIVDDDGIPLPSEIVSGSVESGISSPKHIEVVDLCKIVVIGYHTSREVVFACCIIRRSLNGSSYSISGEHGSLYDQLVLEIIGPGGRVAGVRSCAVRADESSVGEHECIDVLHILVDVYIPFLTSPVVHVIGRIQHDDSELRSGGIQITVDGEIPVLDDERFESRIVSAQRIIPIHEFHAVHDLSGGQIRDCALSCLMDEIPLARSADIGESYLSGGGRGRLSRKLAYTDDLES